MQRNDQPVGTPERAPVRLEQNIFSITLDPQKALALYRSTLMDLSGLQSDQVDSVVWSDGENELIVRVARVRIIFQPGLILVGIPVFCEQTAEAEVVVAFAVGQPDLPLGLIAAAEDLPRGPEPVVSIWGESLIGVTWQALMRVSERAIGQDDEHCQALPLALAAGKAGLTIFVPRFKRD